MLSSRGRGRSISEMHGREVHEGLSGSTGDCPDPETRSLPSVGKGTVSDTTGRGTTCPCVRCPRGPGYVPPMKGCPVGRREKDET